MATSLLRARYLCKMSPYHKNDCCKRVLISLYNNLFYLHICEYGDQLFSHNDIRSSRSIRAALTFVKQKLPLPTYKNSIWSALLTFHPNVRMHLVVHGNFLSFFYPSNNCGRFVNTWWVRNNAKVLYPFHKNELPNRDHFYNRLYGMARLYYNSDPIRRRFIVFSECSLAMP